MLIYLFVILFLGLFLLMLIPTMILSLIMRVMSWFGIGRKRNSYSQRTTWQTNETGKQWQENHRQQKTGEKKVLFEKNEGEYVDFEEIKNDER